MCLNCKKEFTPNGQFWKSCTNLTKHLDKCPSYSAVSQRKRTAVEQGIRSFAEKRTSQEDFQRRFVMALTSSMISINFLRDHELLSLFQDIGYSLPSRNQYWKIHSSNAAMVRKCVIDYVSTADYMAISTDGWSSIANVGFNALVIHLITKNWILSPFCLGMRMFDKSGYRQQKAVELAADLRSICDEYPDKKLLDACEYFVADTTNLMPATARILGKKAVGCITHIANLALRDMILGDRNLSVLCGISSIIVRHVRKSPAAKANIKPNPSMILYTKTRFYSFLDMINSVFLNIEKLKAYTPHCVKPEFGLAVDDFISIQQFASAVIEIMTPFKRAFTSLGADLQPTANKAILFVLLIKRNLVVLRAKQNPFANTMLSIVDRRFAHIFESDLFLLGNILDPVVRDITRDDLPVHLRNKQRELLEDEFHKVSVSSQPHSSQNSPIQSNNCEDSIEKLFGKVLEEETEIDSFLSMKIRQSYESFDVLKWYKSVESSFPTISIVARKILTVPAASISVERVFSMASQIVTKRRNRLSSEHVDTLLTTKFNLNQLRRLGKSWREAIIDSAETLPQNLVQPATSGAKRGRKTNAHRTAVALQRQISSSPIRSHSPPLLGQNTQIPRPNSSGCPSTQRAVVESRNWNDTNLTPANRQTGERSAQGTTLSNALTVTTSDDEIEDFSDEMP